MKLVPVSFDDLPLYKAMFCDPVHMEELGGVQPEEKVPSILERQVSVMETGKGWVYKIVPDKNDWRDPSCELCTTVDKNSISWVNGVGTVCLWRGSHKDEDITEIGWGVIPKYQSQGFASLALGMLLDMAKDDGRWGSIHAFTGRTNTPSNHLALKVGFKFVEACEIDYDDRMLNVNHYIIDPSEQEFVNHES
eukprot:gene2058-2246_t